jgi:hypothetical protein
MGAVYIDMGHCERRLGLGYVLCIHRWYMYILYQNIKTRKSDTRFFHTISGKHLSKYTSEDWDEENYSRSLLTNRMDRLKYQKEVKGKCFSLSGFTALAIFFQVLHID